MFIVLNPCSASADVTGKVSIAKLISVRFSGMHEPLDSTKSLNPLRAYSALSRLSEAIDLTIWLDRFFVVFVIPLIVFIIYCQMNAHLKSCFYRLRQPNLLPASFVELIVILNRFYRTL